MEVSGVEGSQNKHTYLTSHSLPGSASKFLLAQELCTCKSSLFSPAILSLQNYFVFPLEMLQDFYHSSFTNILPSTAPGSGQEDQLQLLRSSPFLWPLSLLQHWCISLSQTFATPRQALSFLQEPHSEVPSDPPGWGNPGHLTPKMQL